MVGTSLVVPRHHTIRLTCRDVDTVIPMLMYADRERSERLNIPDTLKAQMSMRIKPGMVLMSDMGRALASVRASSLDWHDAITGHGRDAQDSLLQELMKHDLSARDLHATVNWFSKVAPVGDERGTLSRVLGHAAAGDWVELRTELDVLVVLATSEVDVAIAPTEPPEPGDPCRLSRDEAGRALALSERGRA